MTKLRWHIAYLLNRLPGQCWSDLVMWALRTRPEPGSRSPWSPAGATCRYPQGDSCYCGKLRRQP